MTAELLPLEGRGHLKGGRLGVSFVDAGEGLLRSVCSAKLMGGF